jgi:replicative superfamily II helicase
VTASINVVDAASDACVCDQSRVCDTALYTGENLLICAPTGAGKTNVAMLCVLHELGLHRAADGTIDTSAFKVGRQCRLQFAWILL